MSTADAFAARVETYVGRLLVDGRYPLDPERVASAGRIVQMCQASGVAIVLVGCSKTTTERLQLPPLEVVPHVELERYLGTLARAD